MITAIFIGAYTLFAFLTLFTIITISKVEYWDEESLVVIGGFGTLFWPLFVLYLISSKIARFVFNLMDAKTTQLANRIRG